MGFDASEIKLLQRGQHLTSARTPGLPDCWGRVGSLGVNQRGAVSPPDKAVAAPTTAGVRHRRRRAQVEAPLAERGFDRAHERWGVGEVVHGQGKRIATGVRVGHRGCGSMADVAERGAVAIAAIRVCGCDDSPRH